MIQNTNAIVAQDASDSSGLAVLETNVILKSAVTRGPADSGAGSHPLVMAFDLTDGRSWAARAQIEQQQPHITQRRAKVADACTLAAGSRWTSSLHAHCRCDGPCHDGQAASLAAALQPEGSQGEL